VHYSFILILLFDFSCIHFLGLGWVGSDILSYLKSNIRCRIRFDLNCRGRNNCFRSSRIGILIHEDSWNILFHLQVLCQITTLTLSLICLNLYWNVFGQSVCFIFINLNNSNLWCICGGCSIACFIRLFRSILGRFNVFGNLFRLHIFTFVLLDEVWCIFLSEECSLLNIVWISNQFDSWFWSNLYFILFEISILSILIGFGHNVFTFSKAFLNSFTTLFALHRSSLLSFVHQLWRTFRFCRCHYCILRFLRFNHLLSLLQLLLLFL